ncbi:MAG: 4-hydroxy-3-methylbut-2-enyl diphosphate reductase [Succinivibrio sp.]
MTFSVKIAKSRGMCAGVERAIHVVLRALEIYGSGKVWILHEVVHNKHVVEDLKKAGASFVEDLDEIPEPQGKVLIFSAHGVGIETEKKARALNLLIIDATCPVVTAIHKKMNRAGDRGLDVVVIGHRGHQEVTGTIGQYTGPSEKVHIILSADDVDKLNIDGDNSFFATQTTLSIDETQHTVDALKRKYPTISGPKADDTCRATQVRQNAVRDLAKVCQLVLIAGSANSSNSNRLREVAVSEGAKAYLVDDSSKIDLSWFEGITTVGISAGASAPEYVVTDIVEFLLSHGAADVQEYGSELKEKSFPLPKEVSCQVTQS